MRTSHGLFCGLVFLLAAPGALAQRSDADLARDATDPTASLMSFIATAGYGSDYNGLVPGEDDNSFDLTLRPVVPFRAWGGSHILRMTLPFRVDGPGTEGLGSVTISDLMISDRSWGRVGVGAVAALSREGAALDEFAIGPAIAAVWRQSPRFNLGFVSQTILWSDTFVSSIEPIVAYQMGDGWTLSAGDLQWAYDFKNSRWQSFPIGFELGKVTRLWGQAVRYAINPQWNLADAPVTAGWSVNFTFTILAPGS